MGKRLKDWPPAAIIGLGICGGIITAWQTPSGETLPPLILAAKLGAFAPAPILSVVLAFFVNRTRFITDVERLGMMIGHFISSQGAVVVAVLLAAGGLFGVHVYRGNMGLLWNIIYDRIYFTSQCQIPSPPNDWVPATFNPMDCVIWLPYSVVLLFSLALMGIHVWLAHAKQA